MPALHIGTIQGTGTISGRKRVTVDSYYSQFDASRREKKELKSFRDKNEGTYRRGGEKSPCLATPDLSE